MRISEKIILQRRNKMNNKNNDAQKFQELMKQFSSKKILVLGDFCLDEYIFGDMESISPEAPIPRIIIKEKKYIPGAAGNVVCGVQALNAQTIAAGVIGKDINGNILVHELQKRGISTRGLIQAERRNTATYSRLVCGGYHCPKQQIVRFDVENKNQITNELHAQVQQFVLENIPAVDAIIVADYDEMGGMGIVTASFMEKLVAETKKYNKPIIGDSRKHLSYFKGFTTVVPNDFEAGLFVGKKLETEEELLWAGEKLRKDLSLETGIITRGKDGISIFEEKGVSHHPTVAKEVFDVTGAGDTVTCIIALARACGASFADASILANYGASITVSKEGTVAVTTEEVVDTIQRQNAVQSLSKQKKREELKQLVQELKEKNKSIVFLNGYFDPLHIGHMELMTAAKAHGDVLVVGVNSDKSVRDNKGPNRPFMIQDKRTQLLASIEAVDYIVLYDELTPIKLIQELQPNILAKGNNYTKEEVVGKDIVESYGGKVVLLDMIQGLTSDVIVEAMQKR